MTRVGIVGATGYAGAELVRIIAGHPEVELAVITSRQFAGVKFSTVYPSMTAMVDLVCEEFSVDLVCDRADILFLALPHKLPMAFAPQLLERNKRIIDLSADFRFNDAAVYESAYQLNPILSIIAVLVSVLTLASFTKVFYAAFLGAEQPEYANIKEVPKSMTLGMAVLAGVIVLFSLFPGLVVDWLARPAADALVNQAGYINAIMGMGP